jgi:hypothetical protein
MKRTRFFGLAAIAFSLSLIVLLAGAVLSFDVYIRNAVVSGPFPAETPGSRALAVDLRSTLPGKKLFSTGGDGPLNPYQSTLRANLGQLALGPAHTVHDRIRTMGVGAFSHWDDNLIFSLPTGVENSAATQLGIRYAVRVRPNLISAAFFIFVLSGLFLTLRYRASARDAYEKKALTGLRLAGQALNAAFLLILAAAAFFLATIVFGMVDGYALPNTAVFRIFPQIEVLGYAEPAFGHVILVFALVGVSCAWLASMTPAHADMFRVQEARLLARFDKFGALAIAGLFLFSVGATWAGIPRPQDLSGNAIAGLVPFNDANGHFQHVFFQVLHGTWDPFMARRPFAAAFRTVGMTFSGFHNPTFLFAQTLALALVSYLAVRAVMHWRGVWAGMTFLGLAFILVRHFLPANLTEPLGIFWALAAIPFIVRSLQSGRLFHGAMGLHLTCWALLTRMGSMFTLPALGLWTVITQVGSPRRIVVGMAVVVAILLTNFGFVGALSKLYGTEGGATGSNFSHTICGLTHNTDWIGCMNLYAEDLKSLRNEAEVAQFFYARAREKFVAEPELFLTRLLDGERYFLLDVRERILTGYTGTIPSLFPKKLWMLFVIAGIAWVLLSRRERHELSFWTLIIGSIVASAPFVIFDDGWRVLCTSFPLISLLIASGFSTPICAPKVAEVEPRHVSRLVVPSFLVLAIAGLSFAVPGIAHRLDLLDGRHLHDVAVDSNEELILGARHMAGFLVLPDGAPLPKSPPAIPFSAFAAIVSNSGIEQYQPLVTPVPAFSPPFGMVSVPAYRKKSSGLLIVPPEMMEREDVAAWKVRLDGGTYWYRVSRAEPVLRPSR